MLFLTQLSFSFITGNPISSLKATSDPGFLIEGIWSNGLFILGLLINVILIGYIISIMLSYFEERNHKRDGISFLAEVTLLLGVDEFHRCLLLERFQKDARNSFLLHHFESEYKEHLLVSEADP